LRALDFGAGVPHDTWIAFGDVSMRPLPLRPLILAAAFFGLAGFNEAHSGPAVVPYLCGDGQPAQVVYESGSDYVHALARVTYGGRTIEMKAAPTLYGVRYRTEATDGAMPLAWSLRGEEGILSEAPSDDSYTRPEHALAQCARVREGTAADAGEGHSEH
jgi:hypothetical protein